MNKKHILALCLAIFFALPAAAETAAPGDETLKFYSDFKEALHGKLGLSFGANVSYMAQRLSPSGKQTAVQAIYTPYAEWALFDGAAGRGKINISNIFTHYWGTEADLLEQRGAVAAYINDYDVNSNLFYNFSYTHTLPGALDWVSVTAGQYSLFDFDNNSYTADQQLTLVNFTMSQNPSSTYPLASAGAYITLAPGENWEFLAGYQDANNISGKQLDFDTIFGGQYLGFGAVSYKSAKGKYSFLGYYQPAVEAEDAHSSGWSLNAERDILPNFAVFAKANGAENTLRAIRQSYVLGLAFKDPLNRNELDSVIIGAAYNRLNKDLKQDHPSARSAENVFEAQWNWGLSKWALLTPDVQLYPRAGLDKDKKWVIVSSLRLTLLI